MRAKIEPPGEIRQIQILGLPHFFYISFAADFPLAHSQLHNILVSLNKLASSLRWICLEHFTPPGLRLIGLGVVCFSYTRSLIVGLNAGTAVAS